MSNLDDKTRIMAPRQIKTQSHPTQIQISFYADGEQHSQTFSNSFTIGRSADCELIVLDEGVSRHHAKIEFSNLGWIIKDLGSANGTFVNGVHIDETILLDKDAFHFDNENYIFNVSIENTVIDSQTDTQNDQTKIQTPFSRDIPITAESPPDSERSNPSNIINNANSENIQDDVYDHYFKDKSEEEMGDHTRMVRKIILQEQQKVQKKDSSRYKVIIASVAVLLIISSSIIYYQQVRLDKAQSLAIEMFYDIKTLEVQVAQTEIEAQKSRSESQIASISLKRQKLREMKARYQEYLDEINLAKHFTSTLSKEDQAIVEMAKIFGECDIDLPKEFISEVKKYISKWQSSKRLTNAVTRIERLGHANMVINAMHSAGLAPQFLYLSLQESNFRFDAIGPETRFGIAKGAWQFMPGTGKEYGLKIGPLAPFREHDPDDERFDFEKSSYAAAKYLKKIYSLEAQASGLLVMASYNWGHNRVRRIIKKMPNNPRERNFWKLTQNHKIPKETYDYVFYIFSAAVIGENPELFGFEFKNPILLALSKLS